MPTRNQAVPLEPVPLTNSFFGRDTLAVARDLLGKYLVHASPAGQVCGRIVETEAYCGPHDLACHASKGRTRRTDVMFGPPGHWYVYLIYGMYHCLNIVTERVDFPAAVLIRGVEPISGIAPGVKTDGPGKLCRAFGIDRALNTAPASGPAATLWIEDRVGPPPRPNAIHATPRIGVDYAGPYKDKPWRFVLR